MRVGEKISYLDALKRFSNRPNVIVREGPQAKSSAPGHWTRKHRKLQKMTQNLYGTDRPLFLTTINCNGQVYTQLNEDSHEIDNWKCGRMYICQTKQLQCCIEAGTCHRETSFLHLKDYIVAAEDGWQDVGPQFLDWLTVAPPHFRDKSLRTPLNQHNPFPLSDEDVMEIMNALRCVST